MPHSDDVILRPLDPIERSMFQISQERHGCLRVVCCTRLYGIPFTVSAVQQAVDKIQRRHPLTGAVVLPDMQFHSTIAARAQVVRYQRVKADSWQDALEEVIYSKAINYDQPLMKIAIVAGDPDLEQEFELLLALEHAVCDGISISALLHELLTLATQSPLTMKTMRVPPSLLACNAKQPWVFDPWVLFLHFLVFILKPLIVIIAWCLRPVSETPLRHRRVAVRTLNAEQTRLLVEHARRHQTSVSGALAAAVVVSTRMAQHEIGKSPGSVPLICPVDLRGRYANERLAKNEVAFHVATLLISGRVDFPISGDVSTIGADQLWALARNLRTSMLEKTRHEVFALAGLAGPGAHLASRIKSSATSAHAGFMSNWGTTPLRPTYGTCRLIEMIPLLRVMPINLRLFLAASSNGQLSMSFTVPDVVCDNPGAKAEAFADSVVSNLEKMVAAGAKPAEHKKLR